MRPSAPVVLVHGARTSRTMWRHQLDALARAEVQAEAVDLPGHGARRGEPFTLAAAVDAVRDGVRTVGGRAVVAGLSLGGYVAIAHRARFPQESAGLVAASCSTPTTSPLRPGWLRIARWIEGWPDHGARLNSALAALVLSDEGVGDLGAGGYALTSMSAVLRELAQLDVLRSLEAGHSPVWLVNGRYDHFRTAERALLRSARSAAPARLVVVPRARHLVSLDAPVAFDRVLLEAASRSS